MEMQKPQKIRIFLCIISIFCIIGINGKIGLEIRNFGDSVDVWKVFAAKHHQPPTDRNRFV